jgi:hypothetical protein
MCNYKLLIENAPIMISKALESLSWIVVLLLRAEILLPLLKEGVYAISYQQR